MSYFHKNPFLTKIKLIDIWSFILQIAKQPRALLINKYVILSQKNGITVNIPLGLIKEQMICKNLQLT